MKKETQKRDKFAKTVGLIDLIIDAPLQKAGKLTKAQGYKMVFIIQMKQISVKSNTLKSQRSF